MYTRRYIPRTRKVFKYNNMHINNNKKKFQLHEIRNMKFQ
jgi:hypothetical protein